MEDLQITLGSNTSPTNQSLIYYELAAFWPPSFAPYLFL